jgi:hypothetical protein
MGAGEMPPVPPTFPSFASQQKTLLKTLLVPGTLSNFNHLKAQLCARINFGTT